MTPIQSASLHFREGSSDKVYHAAIEAKDDAYIVTFAYGRRGSTLTTGTKTSTPVPLDQAQKVFDKLVNSKLAKGYHHSGGPAPVYQQTGAQGTDTGIRCQLLNAIEFADVSRFILSPKFCLQQKHDGRRMLVRKQGETITGINRRGLVIAIPEPIRHAVSQIGWDVLIDGEAVGETLHAFDLLELDGACFRRRRYIDRFDALLRIIPTGQTTLQWTATALDPDDKLAAYEEIKSSGGEGVVFKDIDAPFSPGRPNSGGPQLKFKFVESASFVVTGRNARRSVTIGLYDGDTLVPAGNVTIPPNHPVPETGNVCDVRFLYALKQSGSVYQPVYLGRRDDIPPSECVVEQLKYKPEPAAA